MLTPIRREEALDIGDHKNQKAEKHRNLDHIVHEKLDASAPAGCGIQTQGRQSLAKDRIQLLHAEKLVLEEVPC